MRRRRWYFISLSLPFIIPLLMGFLLDSLNLRINSVIGSTFLLFSMSLLLTALPYAIFIILCVAWGYRKSTEQIARASWVLPLLFIPVALIGITHSKGAALTMPDMIFFSVCILVFGCFYVALAHGLGWLMSKAGWIRD